MREREREREREKRDEEREREREREKRERERLRAIRRACIPLSSKVFPARYCLIDSHLSKLRLI